MARYSLWTILLSFLISLPNQNAIAERRTRRIAAEPNQDAGTMAPDDEDNQPSPSVRTSINEKPPEMSGQLTQYWFGYEGPGLSSSVFQSPAVSFGAWFNGTWGGEVYLGYAKTSDTIAANTTTTTNPIAKTQLVTTTYSGSASAPALLLGGSIKRRIYQARWFGVSTDLMLTLTPGRSVSYKKGTHSVNTPNTDSPATNTVTDTGLGTVKTDTATYFRIGPRFTAAYNLPFLPQLQLGTSIGILLGFGGSSTTTTTTQSQIYPVVSGADQPATSQTTTNEVIARNPGDDSNTYAVGGTGVGIGQVGLIPVTVVGTFRLSYAF